MFQTTNPDAKPTAMVWWDRSPPVLGGETQSSGESLVSPSSPSEYIYNSNNYGLWYLQL